MTSNSFSLRPATQDDLPRILEIERESYPQPWTEASFQAELTKPYSEFLVITDDETDTVIVAYIVYWLMFEECQILNLTVSPEHRGLGFAKQLVRKVVSVSTKGDIKRIILDVRKSNQPAIQLYQSIGFTIDQVRKAFYNNGEDAYQMVLCLTDGQIAF
jgi:[ribosomal protein S18]-alanine N-acetyltransferase